jgi:serine/threonine-protein phosphatase 5
MGCCASKDQEQEFTSINDGNPKSTDSDAAKGTPAPAPAAAGSKPKRPSRASVGEVKSGANANKWSMLESAEEKGFLRDEEEESQAAVDAVLKAEYPNLQKSRSRYAMPATWRQMSEKQDYGEGDFVFKRPWTMQQAHAFYFHLCQTDEARRNGKRSDAEPAFPKRCVYELMSDAYAMYDQLATERGALQRIPPPKSAAQKLKVCGDTHGQLQDVLWIFDEHGEPSADNAYLFNGDIADRGKNALEIFCLLLLYQLAEVT